VIGGADSLSILPYNEGFEKYSEFASRIAINQQHILKNESYLDKVTDIAGGSYYIETITDTVAEKAWEQFKLIESKGGFIACLKNSFIQDLIQKGAEDLKHEFKEGKLILVGVNKYENKAEKVRSLELAVRKKTESITTVIPIKPIRLASEIETQRTSTNTELRTK
jgi:methylmalonyl-CoA mutase